jgi:rfaE bifunctional protein kinase chain/domain
MEVRLPQLDVTRASDLIARFDGVRILVVGDVMLDRFIVGRVTRISPEAPVPVVRFQSEHLRLGGAANVAHNVAALGARSSLVGIVGTDPGADRLRDQLAAAGVSVEGLVIDPSRPTTEKVRVVTERNQQVARIDYEHDGDAAGEVESRVVARVQTESPGAGAILASDYLKGVITRPVIEAALATRSARAPLIVDPKIPHLACYAGATLVTPNHLEAETATNMRIRTDADTHEAAHAFRRAAQCEAVLITLGEQGMWLSDATADGSIDAIAREVADVTGAGDTVVATLALAMAAGASLVEAAVLASHAAGIVVGRFGPATVTREELLASLGDPRVNGGSAAVR